MVFVDGFVDCFDMSQEKLSGVFNGQGAGATYAFNQHFYRAVGQFQYLQYLGNRTHRMQVFRLRFLRIGVKLCQQKYGFVVTHCRFKCGNRFGAAYKQRQHHVRIYHDVPQG